MAGIHQYSSSLFIQSGSAAEFKTGITASEITVEGTVFATEYKKLDGSLITGTGGVEFFAGSGSGVSRSLAEGGPFSQDHFFIVEGANKVNEGGFDILIPGLIKIETTGSSTFNPNYFNFIKVGNDSEDLITVQQGSNPSYIPESISERQAGTHRYIIYAAQTGSSGETHQVFHTVTLDAFVNEKPVIVPGDNTSFNISITHDSNIGSVIIHSTESTDANIEAGEADHLTKYKVIETSAQNVISGYNANAVYSSYDIELIHPNDILENTTELEIIEPLSPGLPNSTLFASASLTNYNLKFSRGVGVFPEPNGNDFIITSPRTGIVEYTVRLEDNYPNDAVKPGFDQITYQINITPPNTASIKNSRVEFELSGFTNELTSTLEQTLLYDFDHTLNSSSIEKLNDRYTSSLVRLKALADIIEPEDGLNPPFDHYTKILIQTESSTTIDSNSPTLSFFQFNGNELTASALDLTNINGGYTTPTESNGFNSFEFYPNYTNNTQSLFIGQHNEGFDSDAKIRNLNRTSKVQHGTNNHLKTFVNNSPSTLILKRPHDINISDISIEVASGSYEPIPSHQLTSSLLYGFTSSLLSDQTQSLITDIYDTSTPFRTTEMLDKFLSQSIVKVRVKAKITEPFGPTHNNIPTTLSDGNGKSVTFNFSSESNDFFTNSPTYEDVNGQELLVGRYTSSWKEFKFEPKNESYEFGVEFTNPSTNVGLTIEEYISASITMSNAEPIQISNVVVEIESGSFATNLGHPSLTSSLLYGLTSSLTSSQTSSFITNKIVGLSNHIHHLDYISQSIVRSRIKTRITEPFGPITSDISASITSNNLGVTLIEGDNPLSINLPSHTSTNFASTLEGIINISNEGSNPSFISTLDTITLTKIEIRGSLGENSTINNGDNKLISGITIGNNNLLDNLTSNGDINGDGVDDTVAAVNVIYATGADTYDSNGLSFTNNGDFAPIFIGNESVNLINGDIIFSIQVLNISDLEVRLTFNEPESSTDPFLSEKFLFQADQSDNYNVNPSYNENNQLVSNFTSPFIEIPHIPSGTFNFTHKFTSESTVHTTSLDLSNAQSAEVSMSGVGPTLFKDIRYEIETFGYSEIGTLNAPRTVLYGDQDSSNHTYADSSSAIWSDGTARAAALASQSVSRFRVLATIEEPFGPGVALPNIGLYTDDDDFNNYTPLLIGSNFNLLINQNTENSITNDNNLSSSISSYVDKKLRTAITSSFVGQTIQSLLIANNNDAAGGGNFTVTSSLIYNMEGDWEPNISQIVDATNQTTLKILNVPPTTITFVRFRTETEGYSGVIPDTAHVPSGRMDTTRTILYGDPSITNDGTGSEESGEHFTNHINSIPYASSSVTRFKPRAIVIEPVGHLHSNTTIVEQWSSSVHNDIDKTLTFNTESNGTTISYNSPYGEENQLAMGIQPDYVGQILSSSNQNGTDWTYTGSITHPNERGFTLPSYQPYSRITIYDTPNVEITRGIPLIETFGDSEIGIDNQNIANFIDQNRTLITGEINTFKTSNNLPENLTGSAVLRIQNQIKIKEPLGYAHKNITSSNFIIKNTDGSSTTIGPTVSDLIIEYNTSSANLHTSGYDENFLLTSSYTSSFNSGGLALPANGYVYEHDSVDFSFSNPASESLNALNTSKQLAFRVIGSSDVQISNLFIEVENTSGSGVSDSGVNRSSRSTQILYGNTTTETNPLINNLAPNNDSKNQLVSARVLLTQTDPIGITHFTPTVIISGTLNSPSITFNTQSTDVSSSSSLNTINGLVVHYTSSFFPLEFGVGDNQTIIASASKVDDLGTVFVSSSNSNEININVTGPSSPIIDITSLTFSENLSQSKFDPSDSANSNYFVLKPHNDDSNQTINVTTNHNVTKPTLRTGSSAFPEELDISLTDNTFDQASTSVPADANGTGSVLINIETGVNNNTNKSEFTITSKVKDKIVGTAEDTETVTIHTIPAQPKSLESDDFATKIFHGHPETMKNTLYHGKLPHGLVNYETIHLNQMDEQTDSPPTVTNIYKIGFNDGDDITFHTHTDGIANYTGNYSTPNRAYNFGDSGSLEVKLNGVTVVNYNLQNEFVEDDKDTSQNLLGYTNNGTASFTGGGGELILNKVAPFNNISQSIQDGDIIFPNGYQAWDATIKVTEKARSGSNVLQLIHNISQSNTQSTAEFKWYYDEHKYFLDGDETKTDLFKASNGTHGRFPQVINTSILRSSTFADINPQHYGILSQYYTFALSGIRYFKPDIEILYNFASIYANLANDTLTAATNNTLASMNPLTNLHIATGSNSPSSNQLFHNVNDVSSKNGLVFDNGGYFVIEDTDYPYNTQPMVDLIPSISLEEYDNPSVSVSTDQENWLGPNNFAHGSVKNIRIKGINVNEFETAETNAAAAIAEVATAFTNYTTAKEASASAAALAEETPTTSNINAATNASSSAGDALTIYNDKKELRDEANNIFYASYKGEFRQIDFGVIQRDTSSANSVLTHNSISTIGRFANPPVSTQTRLVEDFSSEEFRLSEFQGENIDDLPLIFSSVASPFTPTSTDVYGLFTSSISCSYNSFASIQSTSDLIVTLTKTLSHPTLFNFQSSSIVNIDNLDYQRSNDIAPTPNNQNYTNHSNTQRTFYRAFAFTPEDFGGTFGDKFSLEITSSIPGESIFYSQQSDLALGIKISIAYPGPRDINGNGLPIQTVGPGTGYGIVNSNKTLGGNSIMENGHNLNDGGVVRYDTSDGSNHQFEDGLYRYRFRVDAAKGFNNLSNAGGVVILEIKDGRTPFNPLWGYIKQIRLSPNASNGFDNFGIPL